MCGDETQRHKILGIRLNQSQGRFPKRKCGITTTIMQCSNCGLIYSNPQPIPFDIQQHYGVAPEEYWTDQYFILHDEDFAYELEKLKMLLNNMSGKSLDIGAGIGKCMVALEKAGFDAYGFEPSESFYMAGLKRLNMNPEKYIMQTIETADYDENSFDFITYGAVLEHLYDPSFAINKAMKWLKPNGIMHIEVPSANFLTSKLVNIFYRLTGTHYVANLSPMHTPYHLYEFTLKSFTEHARLKNEYEIAFHEIIVIDAFTYLPKFLNFFLLPYMKRTETGMQLCVWLRKK